MSQKRTYILEVSQTHIKLLSAQQRSVVADIRVVPIEGLSEAKILEKVRALVEENKFSISSIILNVPRRNTIVKTLQLPSTQDHEIKKMLNLQLPGHIPYALGEIVYDYSLIRKDTATGYSHILVFVVLKSALQPFVEISESLNIKLELISLSSIGIGFWLGCQEEKKKVTCKGPVVVIDIDQVSSEIAFYQNKTLLYSRPVAYGVKDLNDIQLQDFVDQIEVSFEHFKKESGLTYFEQVIVVSILKEAEILIDQLKDRLGINVKLMSYFESVSSRKNMSLEELKLSPGVSLCAVIGFILTQSRRSINLIPQEVHETTQMRSRIKQWLKFACLLIIALALGAGVYAIEVVAKDQQVQKFTQLIESQETAYQKAIKQERFIQLFTDRLKHKIFVADVVQEAYKALPDDISFRSIAVNGRGIMTLEGYGTSNNSVNNFQSGLVKSSLFKDVNLQYSTKRKIFNMEVADFRLTATVKDEGLK